MGDPMPGHDLSWQRWLASAAPHIDVSLMAQCHIDLWEWEEALQTGVTADAFFADWPRDYGKTTSMRLIMARMAVCLRRRFGLYVCSTQESANNHVTSMRSNFEALGLGRAESKYGHALGWSGERLRTSNGFTVVALGLDTAAIRGLNLDNQRPDLIVFDDIDSLDDSVENVDKKKRTIAQTVIASGSRDCAYLFGQNEIHANSVMHWFVSGEADALRRRQVSKVVAVEGFECKTVPSLEVGKPDTYEISSGISTWPGKTLIEWTETLNRMGENAFRRECQHELGAGGLFFKNFHAEKVDPTTGLKRAWHVCPMPKIEPWYDTWGSGDYGVAAPACYHIAIADKWGVVTVIGEEYRADRTSKQQGLGLLLLAHELGVGSEPPAWRNEDIPGGIEFSDEDGKERPVETRLERLMLDWASTFPPTGQGHQTAIQRQQEYPVEVFWRYGIPAVPAVKDVIAGLRNFADWIGRTVTYPANHPTMPGLTVPMFRIAEDAAPMLQGYLEKALKHPKDPRFAVAPGKFEHAGDSGRYLLSRPEPSGAPAVRKDPELADWVKKEFGMEAQKRQF